MTIGLLDLSKITEHLIDLLTAAATPPANTLWSDEGITPLTITPTGRAPDAVRGEEGCQLSIYLFHVTADKFHRNTYPLGGPAQRLPYQPLALTLYYLVTASAPTMIAEQQAMSVALKCFHEATTLRFTVPRTGDIELTLTLEPQTIDDIGRLWQAVGTPMRLSAVYRVGVVFMLPPDRPAVHPVLHPPTFDEPDWNVEAPKDGFTITPGGRFAVVDSVATIDIAGAVFATTTTTVSVRALALTVAIAAPGPAQFQVASATRLIVRLPGDTPPGAYLTTVRDSTAGPVREVWLDVPVPKP